METPSRRLFHVECIVPPDKTPQESLEWMQKVFDFYYPSYEGKVTMEEIADSAPPNTDSVTSAPVSVPPTKTKKAKRRA